MKRQRKREKGNWKLEIGHWTLGERGSCVPIAFMGSCFAGAMAISHAFFSFRVSVSSVVGGLRTEACGAFLDCERCFALSAAVKPGGSGIEEALGLAEGALLRSSTHLGVGGGCAAMVGL